MNGSGVFRKRLLIQRWPLHLVGASLLMLSTPALAERAWQASVSLNSEYTDNANRAANDKLSERQDEAQLILGAGYENSLLELEANYRVSERRFDRGSQEDRSLLEGRSSVLFGKPHQPADLLLTHTRTTVLNAPDDIDLLRNNDERQILSAMPSLRWSPTRVDTLTARGTYAQVDYRLNSDRNSERVGGSLLWQRQLSATDQLVTSVQHMEISFDRFPLADYQYQSASVAYSAELRRLDYEIQLGFDETTPEFGPGLSGPSARMNINYDTGFSRWRFEAQRYITDNSMGGGNQGIDRGFDNFRPGDSSAGALDQLERTRVELAWNSDTLCGRCTFTATVFAQDDDYRLEAEDRVEYGLSLQNTYRLSPRASLNIRAERRDNRFASDVGRDDFQADRARLSYDYEFPQGIALSLFARWEQRHSDNDARDYDEHIGGLSLSYRF